MSDALSRLFRSTINIEYVVFSDWLLVFTVDTRKGTYTANQGEMGGKVTICHRGVESSPWKD
jgi:hypothetical protein